MVQIKASLQINFLKLDVLRKALKLPGCDTSGSKTYYPIGFCMGATPLAGHPRHWVCRRRRWRCTWTRRGTRPDLKRKSPKVSITTATSAYQLLHFRHREGLDWPPKTPRSWFSPLGHSNTNRSPSWKDFIVWKWKVTPSIKFQGF